MATAVKVGSLSLLEAAERSGFGKSLIYRLARRDELPFPVLKIGNAIRVSAEPFERWLETGRPQRPSDSALPQGVESTG